MKSWSGALLNLVLAVLALAGAAVCIVVFRDASKPPAAAGPALEIRDAETGGVYGRWQLAADNEPGGGEFAIEFIHSVNNSPVREIFSAEGNEIRPVAVRFFSFGAGMQSDPEAGQVMSRDGEALVLSGPDRRFRKLNYIVGTVSDHLLYINGETISLRDLCGRNAHITIQIKGGEK